MNGAHWVHLCLACTLATPIACPADIYVSYSPDGTPSYSTTPFTRAQAPILRDRQSGTWHATEVDLKPLHRRRADTEALINSTCARHGVDPSLVKAIIEVESGFRANAQSPKGAMGVMQLMPETARSLGVTKPFDAEQNIEAGVKYIKLLIAQHDGNLALALAAYNAGGGAVLRNGKRIPPYRETMDFVPTVLAKYARYQNNRGN